MSYSFREIDNFVIDDTFNVLYNDSITDMEGGTARFTEGLTPEEKKNTVLGWVNGQWSNEDNIKKLIISKDGVDVIFIQACIKDNTYFWQTGLARAIDGSKSYLATKEFYEANRDYIQSLGYSKWGQETLTTGTAVFFTGVQNAGKCVGTFSKTDDEDSGASTLIWEY